MSTPTAPIAATATAGKKGNFLEESMLLRVMFGQGLQWGIKHVHGPWRADAEWRLDPAGQTSASHQADCPRVQLRARSNPESGPRRLHPGMYAALETTA